jgi:hypothetical protein
MDKFPSVEVLSRYTDPLLPTCCQQRTGGLVKSGIAKSGEKRDFEKRDFEKRDLP